MKNQPDIDKIYLYAKDPYKAKHQFLISKQEKVGLKHYNDPKAFMEYSNDLEDFKKYWRIQSRKETKVLIVFDDMIADIINT